MSHGNLSEDEILAEALLRSNHEDRVAYLDAATAGNEMLKRRIEVLLSAHLDADRGAFMNEPPSELRATFFLSSEMIPMVEKVGDRIGRYKLLEQIGEGGCGIVYVAEQEAPVRRRVALKVIKLGMDTRSVIARFEAERQALALMDHPNIAKILDGGATETGRPYFVMELVRGIRITDYCDENNLTTQDRLKLFVQVCQAIQHAHQKGIIHRDIKPSNVLITHHDGVPVPKIIDFGIAKATTDQPLTDKTIYTALAQFIGTPAYMSPEQAEMSGLDIDTRSDIYGLGVLLYELLTGNTPFDAKRLLAKGLDEIRRIIREEEPPLPSTRLNTLPGEEQTSIAMRRHSEPPKLISLIRGDLDWIVMKTLEKDRGRRYETANGLAADIQRHINNEPVHARPPSPSYRLQKMIHRNKLAVAAGASVMTALLVGLSISMLMYFRERTAREKSVRAERQQELLHRRAEAERAEAAAQAENARREKRRADDRAEAAHQAIQELRIQKAEDLLATDNTPRALALLAQVLREDPSNRVAAQRITSVMLQHNFMLPLFNPLQDIVVSRFSPDGNRLATVNARHELAIRGAKTGEILVGPVDLRSPPNALEFSGDGSQLLSVFTNRISVRESETLRLVRESEVIDRPIWAADFTPDGLRIISVSTNGVSILDGLSGRVLIGPLKTKGRHEPYSKIEIAAFGPDRSKLASVNMNSETQIWDARTGLPVTELLHAGASTPTFIFNKDGTRFLVGCMGWELGFLYDLPTRKHLLLDHGQPINVAHFSADGQTVATGGGRFVKVWDADSGYLLNDRIRLENDIGVLRFDSSGKHLITASDDGIIRVWDSTSGLPTSERLHFTGAVKVALSPDGRCLLLQFQNRAEVWSLLPGQALAEPAWLSEHKDEPNVSPDKHYEVELSGMYNGSPTLARILDHRTKRPISELLDFDANIFEVKFTADSKAVLFGTGFVNRETKGSAILIDCQTGRKLFEAKIDDWAVVRAEFSPDGSKVALGSNWGVAHIVDVQTGAYTVKPMRLGGNYIHGLTFSHDGCLLFVASDRYEGTIWRVATGEKILDLKQATAIRKGGFSPDGKWAATAGDDRFVRIWDLATGRIVRELRHNAAVNSIAFRSDGTTIATGSKDGNLRIWDFLTGQPLIEPVPLLSSDDWGVFRVEFLDHGKRVTAHGGGGDLSVDLPCDGPSPVWLPDLAEALGGEHVNQYSQAEAVSSDRIFAARAKLITSENTADDPFLRTGRWFFTDRLNRTLSPLSSIKTAEYVARTAAAKLQPFDTDLIESLVVGDPFLSNGVHTATTRLTALRKINELQRRARILLTQDTASQAEAVLRQALDIRRELPDSDDEQQSEILLSLGYALKVQNKTAEAEQTFQQSLSLRKRLFGQNHFQVETALEALAELYKKIERWAAMEAVLRERMKIEFAVKGFRDDSRDSLVTNLIFSIRRQGKVLELNDVYEQIRTKGGVGWMNSVAWVLATASDASVRDGVNAVTLAKRAVELTGRKDPECLDTLAAAHAEAGKFETAVATQKEAIALLTDADERSDFEKRLKLFESGLAYHQSSPNE